MNIKKKLGIIMMASLMCVCTGCASSVADNTETYFSTVGSTLNTWFANNSEKESGGEKSTDKIKLDTPGEFTLDENGNYSFIGVENADYYLVYFCAPDAVNDGDAFLYSSDALKAEGEGGESYEGNIDDLLRYGYGEYLVKVFAFPSVNDSQHEMSMAATTGYSCSGEQDAPVIDYLWNTFDDTVEVQLSNIDTYTYQCYPDTVDVTFINTEDASDVTVITMEDLSPEHNTLVSDNLKKGTTYNITAVSKSSSAYVLNSESDVADVADNVTFADTNVMSENYLYTDGIARASFSYPQVCENFDLENAGAMNELGVSLKFTFTATPTTAGTGCAYSYIVAGDCRPFSFEDGTLDLYTDGTFLMCQNSEMPPQGPSTIQGIWKDNGDGTATLSFNHATLTTSVD